MTDSSRTGLAAVALATLVTLAGSLLYLTAGRDPALARFEAGLGQRHYALVLDGAVRGRVEEVRSLEGGAPRIRTESRINLPGGGAYARTELLSFTAERPHALERRTLISRSPLGVRDRRDDADRDGTLADWLDDGSDGIPALLGREIDAALWSTSEDGFGNRVLTTGTGSGQRIVLDGEGRLLEYRVGRSFELRRVPRAPILPAPAPIAPLSVPVDRDLGPRGQLRAMTVRVEGPAAGLFTTGPGLTTDTSTDRSSSVLVSRRLPLTDDEALRAQAAALMATVRERLDYVPGASPPDLATLLDRGEGDCWEFAALFDALAKRAGLESRIVTGLAWSGGAPPAFGLHAWIELRDPGGDWFTVDPTWNQLGADAARLRFPDDPATQLDLQFALAGSRIEILTTGSDGEG